jgi:hypothetical protein
MTNYNCDSMSETRIIFTNILSRLCDLKLKEFESEFRKEDDVGFIRLNSDVEITILPYPEPRIEIVACSCTNTRMTIHCKNVDIYGVSGGAICVLSTNNERVGALVTHMPKRTYQKCAFSECPYFNGVARRVDNDIKTVWCHCHRGSQPSLEVAADNCENPNAKNDKEDGTVWFP